MFPSTCRPHSLIEFYHCHGSNLKLFLRHISLPSNLSTTPNPHSSLPVWERNEAKSDMTCDLSFFFPTHSPRYTAQNCTQKVSLGVKMLKNLCAKHSVLKVNGGDACDEIGSDTKRHVGMVMLTVMVCPWSLRAVYSTYKGGVGRRKRGHSAGHKLRKWTKNERGGEMRRWCPVLLPSFTDGVSSSHYLFY